MTTREELETPEDRAAFDLCLELGFEPWGLVPKHDRQCARYEDDYFMNWARDKVDEAIALKKVLHVADMEKLLK